MASVFLSPKSLLLSLAATIYALPSLSSRQRLPPFNSLHLSSPPEYSAHNESIVNTSSGRLQPLVELAFPDVDQFLGVPFAQPPLGDLRFAPPQPYKPTTTNVFNASVQPPSCPATTNTPVTQFTQLEPGLAYSGPFSEDCLKLDLYRPRIIKGKLPVLIWVYGGGFVSGAANKTFSLPGPWVQAKKDVIVVCVQYRSNIFGFPNSAALTRQNLGLEDIRASVEWVRDNVAAFGGDNQRMTLFGHSAGSIAVNAYTFSNIENQIVQSTISMSGSVMTPTEGWQTHDKSQSNFTYIAHQLGCTGNSDALLSCIRTKTTDEITRIAYYSNVSSTMTFHPVPDDILVYANYTPLLEAGRFSKQPAIIGSSRREGFRSIDKNDSPDGPNKYDAIFYTLISFLCPSLIVSQYRHAAKAPTWRYEFAANFTNISPLPWMGAYHESPMPYLFGQTSNVQGHPMYGASGPFENAVSSRFQDLWDAFATNPDSLAAKWDWPQWEGGEPGHKTDPVMLIPGAESKDQQNGILSRIELGSKREELCPLINRYLKEGTLPVGLKKTVRWATYKAMHTL